MNQEASFQATAKINKEIKLPYILHIPDDYSATDKTPIPLVLFLHGKGERGKDIEKVRNVGLPKISETQNLPFIMIAPQCPDSIPRYHNWLCFLDELKVLIEYIVDIYNVDKQRIYITGLSMGGFGTWEMIQQYPNLFAAAIPICGGGSTELIKNAKDIPIWTFHGAKDDVIDIAETERMVDALERIDGNISFTVYPEDGHNSWEKTYNNPKVYEWLLQQRKPI